MTQTAIRTQRAIRVDLIDRDPNQPRTVFSQIALDELEASMRSVGQLQPVSVRYNRSTRRYTLMMGERRWRVAKTIGLETVLAVVEHDVNDEDAFVRGVAENAARADMTPMEEARAFQQLVDYGYDRPRIAAICGKSLDYVNVRLALVQLVPAAAEALCLGHLPVGLAWYVSKLGADSQHRFLAKWARGDFPTSREAESYVQACRNAADQGGLFAMDEPSTAEKEKIISERKSITTDVERLAKAGEILSQLMNMDPAHLAKTLAGAQGGVAAYQARIEHLAAAASKAAAKLRKAAALAAVSLGGDHLLKR